MIKFLDILGRYEAAEFGQLEAAEWGASAQAATPAAARDDAASGCLAARLAGGPAGDHIAAYSPQARGRSERVFQTLQDRLTKELTLAGITTGEAANAFLRETYIPAHNARFAVAPEQEGSAFVAVPGVDLAEILCVQEERQVGNDNCVAFNRLKLQIPASPLRAHFVKARVKVRHYPDGTHAIFHGPRCLGRYDRKGAPVDTPIAA